MKKAALFIFFALSCILPLPALGFSLYFDVSKPVLDVNESTNVSVWISGLGNQAPPNLGGYDLEIGYNPQVLQLDSFAFGSLLGYPGNSLGSFETPSPGTLAVYEVSLLLNGALESLQPGAFALLSMQFTMAALADSTLTFLKASLTDGDGYPIYATLNPVNVYAVPIPSSLLLLSGAVAGLGAFRRLQRFMLFNG
jgi:hypothetical protein